MDYIFIWENANEHMHWSLFSSSSDFCKKMLENAPNKQSIYRILLLITGIQSDHWIITLFDCNYMKSSTN